MVAAAMIGAAVVGGVASNAASRRARRSQEQANAQQQQIADQQSGIASRQQDLAEAQWNRYLTTYGPLEDNFIAQSRDYGSNANRERAASEAGGAVESNYAGLRARLNSTPGIDPSGSKYLETMKQLGVSEAAQKAAAETGARNQVDAEGRARMADAISLGKGLPASAGASLASANAALSGAAGAYSGMAQAAAMQGQTASHQGTAVARMFGDLASNPTVVNGVKGWFSSPGMDTSYYRADDPYRNAGYVGGMEGE